MKSTAVFIAATLIYAVAGAGLIVWTRRQYLECGGKRSAKPLRLADAQNVKKSKATP